MQKVLRFFLVVLMFVGLSQLVCAGTKPVSGLRDYNGTYQGAPGTGTVVYTGGTLYRDNQDNGYYSGCSGEGCGSHPGVDIPLGSGTPIYAAMSGRVVKAECTTTGWGGLVMIMATDPYTGQTIYVSNAHLRKWDYVRANDLVNEGQLIGLSGGGSGDICPGHSYGAHLHFQVDKDHSEAKPWFPSTPPGSTVKAVDKPDYSFQVTQRTYNPIPFVTNGFRWTFGQDGFKEYWTPQNASSSGVSGGAFWIDGNSDPWIWRWPSVVCGLPTPCSAQFAAEAGTYKKVSITMDSSCISNPGKVYFVTSTDPNWSEDKVVTFNVSPGLWTYDVDMSSHWRWGGSTIITGLRIDPAMNCGSWWDPTYFHSLQLRR